MTSITNVRKNTRKQACKHKGMLPVPEISDVFTHCLRTADAISPRFPLLRFAAMMHDIGKVPTKALDPKTNDFKFHNHEVASERMVETICERLGFHDDEKDYVTKIVRHHMYIVDESTKTKTIHRWMRNNPYYRDNLRLRLADRRGNLAKSEKPVLTYHLKNLIKRIRNIEKEKKEDKVETIELDINGKDLIKLGLSPGPIFREIFIYLVEEVKKSPELNTHPILVEKTKKYLENHYAHSTTKAAPQGSAAIIREGACEKTT